MIVECHMILIKNLAESSDENSDENFVILHFDLAVQDYHNSADQNSYNAAEFYFSFL